MADVLTIARSLLARGFSIIPIPAPRPGAAAGTPGDGKVPALPWAEFQTRRPTDAELVAWFGAGAMNLAIVTGAISDIVVVDADSPEGLRWCTRRLRYTPWQVRTARGFHLYYRWPDVRVSNRARIETSDGHLKVDVRGDGGYVIAPGSVHASGPRYTFAGDWSVSRDEVPRFWPGWLQRPKAPTTRRPPSFRPTGDVVERARKYLAQIPPPIIDAGSDSATLSAACRLVRGFNLSPADAEALLWEWAGGRPGWTRDWIATKVAHAEKYGSEPIGGLVS
jgi:hypothetical protein